MSQWGFYFDQTRCYNCRACIAACKLWNEEKRGDAFTNINLGWLKDPKAEPAADENRGDNLAAKYVNPTEYELPAGSEGQINFAEYRKYIMKENWRRVTTKEYGDMPPNVDALHLSLSCNHCADPACIRVCPMGNISKESKFGAVLVGSTCISCGRCKSACPWEAPQFYDSNFATYMQTDPKRPRMTKCTMCYERISEGLKPACVAACKNRALNCGPLGELKTKYPGFESTAANFASDEIQATGSKTNPSIIFKTRPVKVKA